MSSRGRERLRAALSIGNATAAVTVWEIGGAGAEVGLLESACRTLARAARGAGQAELRVHLVGQRVPLRTTALPGARVRTPDGLRLGLRYALSAAQQIALDGILLALLRERGCLRVRADPDACVPVTLRTWGLSEPQRGILLDASMTSLGALICAPKPLGIGTPMEVGLKMERGERLAHLRGTVVRCTPPDVPGGGSSGVWQVGLRFDENESRVAAAGVGRYVVRRQLAVRRDWDAVRASDGLVPSDTAKATSGRVVTRPPSLHPGPTAP
ncbi:MAG: hypothetical protein VX265_03305 [Myxococcota bacterium]|nr:hypothetical protein [Myxococcota bacterium]